MCVIICVRAHVCVCVRVWCVTMCFCLCVRLSMNVFVCLSARGTWCDLAKVCARISTRLRALCVSVRNVGSARVQVKCCAHCVCCAAFTQFLVCVARCGARLPRHCAALLPLRGSDGGGAFSASPFSAAWCPPCWAAPGSRLRGLVWMWHRTLVTSSAPVTCLFPAASPVACFPPAVSSSSPPTHGLVRAPHTKKTLGAALRVLVATRNLRRARKGAGAGPSGLTAECCRVVLDDERTSQLFVKAAQALAQALCSAILCLSVALRLA